MADITAPLDLLGLTERARERLEEDPFGNPVLAVALSIGRAMDEGSLTFGMLETLIHELRDAAFADRAARLAAYVGGIEPARTQLGLEQLAQSLVRPDPFDSPVQFAQFREAVERTRFSAVFTAHPTFALPPEVFAELAEAASGRPAAAHETLVSHRPTRPTLEQEFTQAVAAIERGRDAIDRMNALLLEAARPVWRDRWCELVPRAVTLASWVGYDTDGRTDIGWWDTLRLRLRMKALQFGRLERQLIPLPGTEALRERVAEAAEAVAGQIAACPTRADAGQASAFAAQLVGRRDAAMTSTDAMADLFRAAIAAAEGPEAKKRLAVIRAGFDSHGLSLAHSHVRLNSAQLHNAIRMRLGFDEPPADPSRRRKLLADINAALDSVETVPIDFGAILAEQSSAVLLMMTVAQITKHVDSASPVRFLIAETESGYTLLAALWLARHFGIERQIEISPLFETADALQGGARLIEEALRSPHYRAYLRDTGRLCLQFGYSDSGRYVGQLAATYLIERLRLRVADAMVRHKLTDIEIVFFDTHGESIGRGAHPNSLADRLRYLSPASTRQSLSRAGIRVRLESAFQGGDGYLLFGTPELADATVATIARHVFASGPQADDPIYADADFAADFFASVGLSMQELVEDPGYASLLGAFGPALLDATGSRPSARQSDGSGGPSVIRHPRELRAIPNNAILQQIGWCANTLQGLGAAAARQPESFVELRESSPRFNRALDFARHALLHSDLDVLRAVVTLLDPGSWLDNAAHSHDPKRVQALAEVARALEVFDLWAPVQAMFRRIQSDHLMLRAVWPDAPRMGTRELLLHALRIAVIQNIWLLAVRIPDFSARHGVTRQGLMQRLLRLDVPGALALLGEVFPAAPNPAENHDYGEARGARAAVSYDREHKTIFEPMARLFALVREIGTAITHEVGAFG